MLYIGCSHGPTQYILYLIATHTHTPHTHTHREDMCTVYNIVYIYISRHVYGHILSTSSVSTLGIPVGGEGREGHPCRGGGGGGEGGQE